MSSLRMARARRSSSSLTGAPRERRVALGGAGGPTGEGGGRGDADPAPAGGGGEVLGTPCLGQGQPGMEGRGMAAQLGTTEQAGEETLTPRRPAPLLGDQRIGRTRGDPARSYLRHQG